MKRDRTLKLLQKVLTEIDLESDLVAIEREPEEISHCARDDSPKTIACDSVSDSLKNLNVESYNNLNRTAFITFKYLSQEPSSSSVLLQVD